MAGAAAEILAAAHFLDVNFVALFLGDDFGRDLGTGDAWLSDLDAIGTGNQQHVVERDGVARDRALAEVDLDFVAALYFVLAAVGGNDGIHRETLNKWKPCTLEPGARAVEGVKRDLPQTYVVSKVVT